MTRKLARDMAFKLLYEKDIQNESAEYIINLFFEENEETDEASMEYIKKVLVGCEEHTKEIDDIISKHATGWNIKRISKLTLAGLRLAAFEIVYCDDIPNPVAVNEAVTLIKKYDDEKSAGFANGILATVISEA